LNFPHDDAEFEDLLSIVSDKRGFSPGLVEKDYWVIHTLWALHQSGLEVWFKGGTSLSKGFSIIERFSEDLDVKIEPGRVLSVPLVSNWTSNGTKAVGQRRAFFESLVTAITVPGARSSLDSDLFESSWRSAGIRVTYDGRYLRELREPFKPFVLLEVGTARVTPFVTCDLTSLVHDELLAQGQASDFRDNRPRAVRCVHPLVTLLEKLDALHLRVPKSSVEPAKFVRHFEDAARVIAAQTSLPPLLNYDGLPELAREMLDERQIACLPDSGDPAFHVADDERWDAIRRAYAAIAPIYWGTRLSLEEACTAIREWIHRTLE